MYWAKAREFWADGKLLLSTGIVAVVLAAAPVVIKTVWNFPTYLALALAVIQWPYFPIAVPVALALVVVGSLFFASVQLDRHRRALDLQGQQLLKAQADQLAEPKALIRALSELALSRQRVLQLRLIDDAEDQNFARLVWYAEHEDPAADAARPFARDAEGEFRRAARRYQPERLSQFLADTGLQLGCLAPGFQLQGLDQEVPHEAQLPANVRMEYRRRYRLHEAVRREVEQVDRELSVRAATAWTACEQLGIK